MQAGLLAITPPKYRPERIQRIRIPLDAETRWQAAFNFVAPISPDAQRISNYEWSPQLAFCTNTRLLVPFDDIRRLDDFIRNSANLTRAVVPIKERSLELFADEKRLDQLFRSSVLFDPGRLTLEVFRCRLVPEPLPWTRGARPDGPMLAIENAATWETFRQWDKKHPTFSAIIYGGGRRFCDGVHYLPEIHAELGGAYPLLYFGDLDLAGLIIPQSASIRATNAGLPPVRPLVWAYRALLHQSPQPNDEIYEELESSHPTPEVFPLSNETTLTWLEDIEVIDITRTLFSQRLRLAQEHIGWEYMSKHRLIPLP
jgi:hypothetical protein